MKKIIFLLILSFCKTSIQSQNNKTNALAYIKDYYSDFKTGYDTPSGYFTVTDHYKVELEENIFTIRYDTYMYRKFIKTETIQFDLKKIENIYNR